MAVPPKLLTLFSRHERGGACRRLYSLLNHISQAGARTSVYSAAPLELPAEALTETQLISVPARKTEGFWFWLMFTIIAPFRVFRELWSGSIDAVVVVEPRYAVLVAPAAMLSGVPLIVLLQASPFPTHTEMRRSKLRGYIAKQRDSLGLIVARFIVVPTEALRHEVGSILPRVEPRTIVIPHALREEVTTISDRERAALRYAKKQMLAERFKLPEKWTFLVTSGELTSRKNFECLIRAMAACTNQKLALLVCGDGPDREALNALSAGLGLDEQIVFTGWVDEPLDLISACDLVVLPSPYLGMSHLAVEALGTGVPVIAADVADMREVLVDDFLLFPPGDVGSLAMTLDQLTTSKGALERCAQRCKLLGQRYRFNWGARLLSTAGLISDASGAKP